MSGPAGAPNVNGPGALQISLARAKSAFRAVGQADSNKPVCDSLVNPSDALLLICRPGQRRWMGKLRVEADPSFRAQICDPAASASGAQIS